MGGGGADAGMYGPVRIAGQWSECHLLRPPQSGCNVMHESSMKRVVSFLALATVACGAPAGSPGAPATRISLVVDTLHGIAVEDPYRWLEDQVSPEVRDWIAAQERYADSVMGPANPLRDSLRARLAALLDVASASTPRKAGAFEYFTLRKVGEPVAAIYRRAAPREPALVDLKGTYEKVVDPLAIRDDGTTSVGIEGFSPDGRLMMYSVRDGGPDEITVKVRDLKTLQDLPDSLPAALYASLAFTPDGKAITYVHRSRTEGPRLRRHVLGTEIATDSLLWDRPLAPTAFLNAQVVADGKYRLLTVGHGWARNEVFVQDVKTGTVTDVTSGLVAHFAPQFIDGALWMRTDLDAPRGRVVKVDLTAPARDRWVDVIPQRDITLDAFQVIDTLVWVSWIRDVSHQLTAHTKAGTLVDSLPVPPGTSATLRGAGKGFAHLTLTSFRQPAVTWKVNLASKERTLWEGSEVPFDTAAVEVRQVWYTSRDGTRAPMYLVMKAGAARNPETPVLLSGYGGFALSLMPRFDARAAAWVERGGIFAQATLRGGNEYGEEWHRGGMLLNKQHVFDDFIAAGQYLVDSGYTRPAHLTIRGGSNGGLLMGAALTQRPDLYRAAFVGVPDLDMVRFYTFRTHNNMPALLEYGDASNPEQFAAIHKYSPYQRVKTGEKYPAIMVQTGINDTRVPPWQARRFTARLQAATGSGEPVILYNDLRSGHAGGRSMAGTIDLATKELEFLWSRAAVRP